MEGENIYESPPVLFGNKSSESEYQRKQREITKKLLEATESETVTMVLRSPVVYRLGDR